MGLGCGVPAARRPFAHRQVLRLQNLEHEIQEQQRTTFRFLCMYGGVKSVKVVTDLGDLQGKEFAVESDVAEQASTTFRFLKKGEDRQLFEWNKEGLVPMPPRPRLSPDVNLGLCSTATQLTEARTTSSSPRASCTRPF